MAHTPTFINQTHRTRYYYAKCKECAVITEEAYCIDCFEFMHNHTCGANPNQLIRVQIIEVGA